MFGNLSRRSLLLHRSKSSLRTNGFLSAGHPSFSSQDISGQSSSLADDAAESRWTRTKVLYDGDCNICMKEISVLKRIARKRPVDFVDITSPTYHADHYQGVTYEMAMKEMHVVSAHGKVLVQGDAIREMYRASGLGWLAAFTELPGIRPSCDKMYKKFAEYRLQKALDKCDSGSCSVKLKHLRDKLQAEEVK